jgi:maleylacetoacetate isomerase
MPQAVLYDYYRSSAAYRVRIALNMKGIEFEQRPVNLLESQQKSDEYRALNPQGFVPMLEIDGHRLTQSVAIINYLDLRFPNAPLIPASAAERAHVVSLSMMIACDNHPLKNQRVLKYLKGELGHSQEEVDAWYANICSAMLQRPPTSALSRSSSMPAGSTYRLTTTRRWCEPTGMRTGWRRLPPPIRTVRRRRNEPRGCDQSGHERDPAD